LFVRKVKFHEIFSRNISTNVSESFGTAGSRLLFVRKGKFRKNFGRNIFTIVNGKFGDSRRGGLSGRESFMRFLAGIFLLLYVDGEHHFLDLFGHVTFLSYSNLPTHKPIPDHRLVRV
jgi:hypothetical protein